jgi:hypothetical protein
MKIVEENNEKIFTENEEKDIMQVKHNLLNKNKNFYEREELYVKKIEKVILKEIMKELNKGERIKVKLFSKLFIKVYKLGITNGFNNK